MISRLRTNRRTTLAGLVICVLVGGLELKTATAQDRSAVSAAKFTIQPARLEPYERTPLFAKIQGYVLKTRQASTDGSNTKQIALTDIGDEVAEGEVLAEIDVPEMLEELMQKEALAEQAAAELLQSTAGVTVAEKTMQAAKARIAESEAGVVRARGEYERWKAEHERIRDLAEKGSVTGKLVDETLNQLRSAEAGRDETQAHVLAVEADLAEAEAKVAKAKTDEAVARVRVKVAETEVRRLEALLGYARIRSPYAGIISQRNIDTGHFVQPGTGSQPPLFVVERIDTLRVAVDVPERDAVRIQVGSTAWIQVPAFGEEEFKAKVSRTSWVLDPASRTLRVEIDLSNPDRLFRPGMYAKARIQLSVPLAKAETQSR